MKTVQEAIEEAAANSEQSGDAVPLEVWIRSFDVYRAYAKALAVRCGLTLGEAQTPNGCDLTGLSPNHEVRWRIRVVFDRTDYTCEDCQGTTMDILPFGEVSWCNCALFGVDDLNTPPLPAAWSNVKQRIDRRLAGEPEADDGSRLWSGTQWEFVAEMVRGFKASGQW